MADRRPNGQFEIGNRASPGRPRREVEAAYLERIRETVNLDDWEAIIRRAVADAKKGDFRARQWLSDHLLDRGLADRLESLERALRLRRDDP